ncbi:SspB family protein [Kiloniella laminariae]|uniref:SspB family protein n=1 Tax=Kiloniella laminariae TaxID=454162 RepID=UPI0003677DA3|nr:ClpXP protease specificity-enhancing factor SspB [Kiloniella laminariae]
MSGNNEISESELRYDHMVEKALLNVVRESLEYAAKNGLPGDHHFYITFNTSQEEVIIPDHLKARYPGEMTIILQYQFWDLEVGQDGFSVTLSFSDVPERMSIPYAAIVAFADPSVRFGLQFDITNGENGDFEDDLEDLLEDYEDDDDFDTGDEIANSDENPKDKTAKEKPKDGGTDNIVTLDAFRKK